MKKTMKKLCSMTLALMMVAALAGCGSEKEEKAVLRCKQEQEGYAVEMVYDAKGDKATRVTQTSTLDLTKFPEEALAAVDDALKQAEETYKAIKGVEYSYKKEDNKIIETVIIDLNKDTIKELSEKGLMPIESEEGKEVTYISIERTKESLEKSGWIVE